MSASVTRFSEIEPGEMADCFALLAAREAGQTRDQKPFYRATFRDPHRSATAMIWSDSPWYEECDSRWSIGGFYKLRCRYSESQYGPQIEIERIRPVQDGDEADGFDAGEFFVSTRFDCEAMFAELTALVESEITDLPVRRLVSELLSEHGEEIRQIPAASRNHHAFRGGFLEHVLSVVKTAVFLSRKYADYYPHMDPPLNHSLVVAGAVLHDIGKLRELRYQPQGADYSPAGRLIGHILLGRDMVREKAAEIPELDPEIALRLEHIIVAHQNLPEWGSPVAPHTPEALLVYFSDDIDAKFHMMAAVLEAPARSGEEFSDHHNPLRRRIFRTLTPD